MSTKMMPSSRKPPLPRSPIQLRLRPRPRRPIPNAIQTPPGSLTKTQLPESAFDIGLRPEYRTISCELRALAKMVNQEFSSTDLVDGGLVNILNANRSLLFERGRLYEEYSARRNERLKRKIGETGDGKKAAVYDLGVRVESAKRRETKRFGSLRKTIPCTPMTEKIPASSSRYLLRSTTSKENKKPPLAVDVDRSVGVGEKKIGIRRGTRKN